MSQTRCVCGYQIGFNAYPCRYDGEFIGDSGYETACDAFCQQVAGFMTAIREGRRDEWLRKIYDTPDEISDESAIEGFRTVCFTTASRSIHQCERCGRIWMQREDGYAAPYVPDGEWRGALETPPEDFIGYVAGQNCFGSQIMGVKQNEGVVRVSLRREDDTMCELVFTGVVSVERHAFSDRSRVRYVSEWKSIPNFRRFVIDSTDQGSVAPPLLEITAREILMPN